MSAFHVKLLDKRLACENSKFLIYFQHVVDSEGFDVKDYLVVQPKQQSANLVTGVAILPMAGRQIGLIKIFRPAINDYSWEIPHGFIEDMEKAETSAMRELKEETGLLASHMISLGYVTPDSGVLSARIQLFAAINCETISIIEKEIGLKDFQFFDHKTFESMIKDSKVQDTFTIAAWCKYKLWQESK